MVRTKMEDKELEKKARIIAIFLLPFAFFGLFILDGFLFTRMWQWWVADTFGVASITFVQAMGISLLIAYFRNQHYYDLKTAFMKGLVTDLIFFSMSWGLTFFK